MEAMSSSAAKPAVSSLSGHRSSSVTTTSTRRRYVLAVACLLVIAIVNLVRFTELAKFQWWSSPVISNNNSSSSSTTLSSSSSSPPRTEDCAMDVYHRDSLFLKQAKCATQREVVAILRNLVFTASELFTQHNITYFLDSGTLLGAYRDQRIIPHDTDADISIDTAGYNYIRHHKLQVPDGFFLAVYASGDLYPYSQRDKEIPIRLIHQATALYVDVFVFKVRNHNMVGPTPSWAFDKCVHCPRYFNQGKQLLVPIDWIYPTVNCLFHGVDLQCPQQTSKYLEYMFGHSFMTPSQE